MQLMRTSGLIFGALIALAPLGSLRATPESAEQKAPATAAAEWRETWAYTVGMQAVIYGYPVVRSTNVRFGMIERPSGQVDMPLNTWLNWHRASDATDKLHGSPTPDRLYSAAWFDVRSEPLVQTDRSGSSCESTARNRLCCAATMLRHR